MLSSMTGTAELLQATLLHELSQNAHIFVFNMSEEIGGRRK